MISENSPFYIRLQNVDDLLGQLVEVPFAEINGQLEDSDRPRSLLFALLAPGIFNPSSNDPNIVLMIHLVLRRDQSFLFRHAILQVIWKSIIALRHPS